MHSRFISLLAERSGLDRLWFRFFVAFMTILLVTFMAIFIFKSTMTQDFAEYVEGEMEDRIHLVVADIEGTYEKFGGWNGMSMTNNVVWALLLGVDIRIHDIHGRMVADSMGMINQLEPSVKIKVLSISNYRPPLRREEYAPYPMFLRGEHIGTIEVRILRSIRAKSFFKRTDYMLAVVFGITGVISVLLSIFFSRLVANPIGRLSRVAEALGTGNLNVRADPTGPGEIANLARAFNAMADSIERQESFRKKMIANTSHELRTPLTNIRGEVEGMIDGLIECDVEGLASIHDETGRLISILDGLDDLTRAQSAGIAIVKSRFNLKPLITSVCTRFEHMASERGIGLVSMCPDGLEIYADADRLTQIVVNLLSNAFKATTQGSVCITAYSKDAGVTIEVSDTGKGIEPEATPLIFERFYRSSNEGLGLGLAIVRELVEAHGGTITVESAVGKGSVFRVWVGSE